MYLLSLNFIKFDSLKIEVWQQKSRKHNVFIALLLGALFLLYLLKDSFDPVTNHVVPQLEDQLIHYMLALFHPSFQKHIYS